MSFPGQNIHGKSLYTLQNTSKYKMASIKEVPRVEENMAEDTDMEEVEEIFDGLDSLSD